MSVTQEFRDAVEQKDMIMIRIMIKDILIIDPTFVELNDMISLVNEKHLDIYDDHNGEILKDEDEWTEEYMNKQMIKLLDNFSKERLNLLKKMCTKLYSGRIKMIEDDRKNNLNSKKNVKNVGASLIVGGAVTSAISAIAIKHAAVVGAIAVKPLIITAGVSMMIVGGAMIIMGGE